VLVTSVGNVEISGKNFVDVTGNEVSVQVGNPTFSLGLGVTATGSSVMLMLVQLI
jgi:hypothetical protein